MSFQHGVDEYHSGRHYEAHELWEELWQDEADDDRRRFLQALIQVTSAVHKAVHDVAPRGAVRLLDAATAKLEGLGDVYLGIDLATLRTGIESCRQEIERQLDATGHSKLSAEHVPPLIQLSGAPLFVSSPPDPAVPNAARGAWFDRGLACYAAGEYFEAHELWEEIWRDAPPSPDRVFLQGLIQVAAAMHKVTSHGKPKPAARLLGRAIDKLVGAPAGYRNIDTTRLLGEARKAKAQLEIEADFVVPSIGRVHDLSRG